MLLNLTFDGLDLRIFQISHFREFGVECFYLQFKQVVVERLIGFGAVVNHVSIYLVVDHHQVCELLSNHLHDSVGWRLDFK